MVPMSMLASTANFDIANVATEKKTLPKSKEPVGAKFENVLKKVSNNRDSKLGKISEKIKPENPQNQDSTSLMELFPSIGLLLPEADQEKLVNELNMALEEMGISLQGELDALDLAGINEMLAALASDTGILNQGVTGDQIKQIILSQILNAKPELNNTAFLDEEVNTPINEGKELSPELVTNLSKQETKPKTLLESRNFRLFEDKASIKTENNQSQSQTDIKKLISSEINRINGVKQATTPNNALGAEQPVTNEEETATINPVKLDSLETKLDTKILQTATNSRPVEVKEIIDQIVNKAELLLKQNASEIKINLKPEFLGKMTIKIAIEEGVLTAKFITDNMHVKHLLESNLNTLRQSLESQGIKVEKTEVNVQLNNGGMYDGSENGRESRWEKPENQVSYAANEVEEFLEITEDIPVADKEISSGYLEFNEEGALSFLI